MFDSAIAIQEFSILSVSLIWSLAFPIILGMLFYFMFGGINDLEQFEEVPVGVLTNSDLPEMFVSMMEEVQTENKIPLFRVKKYTDRKIRNSIRI